MSKEKSADRFGGSKIEVVLFDFLFPPEIQYVKLSALRIRRGEDC